jgi:hypothetical protein
MPDDHSHQKGDSAATTADSVIRDLQKNASGKAAQEVEDFWREHRSDGQWDQLMADLHTKENNDPCIKALFDDFHITYTEKDGTVTNLALDYVDHGAKIHETPLPGKGSDDTFPPLCELIPGLSDLLPGLQDPSPVPPEFFPPHVIDPPPPGLRPQFPPKGSNPPQTGGVELPEKP